MTQTRLVAATALVLLFGGLPLSAAPVDYVREIKPVLAARCYVCHGGLRQKGDLAPRHPHAPPRGRQKWAGHRSRSW